MGHLRLYVYSCRISSRLGIYPSFFGTCVISINLNIIPGHINVALQHIKMFASLSITPSNGERRRVIHDLANVSRTLRMSEL
jgi:hypothetical protein